jgi:hypothetical protein
MFLCTVAKWRPPFEENRGPAPFYEGCKLAQTMHEFWLAQFLSVREGTRVELLHHEGIYNMHNFLPGGTNRLPSPTRISSSICLSVQA